MTQPILITYATRTGSTADIAEAIGKRLTEHGALVKVHPMHDVSDLAPYSAVVVGSAIQNKQWLPEAIQFLRQHQSTLRQKPNAAFLVCMTLAMKNTAQHSVVKDWMAPIRALIRPASEGYFAGVLDIAKVPGFGARLGFRISVMMGVWSEGDHRDWDAVNAWADDLAVKLRV